MRISDWSSDVCSYDLLCCTNQSCKSSWRASSTARRTPASAASSTSTASSHARLSRLASIETLVWTLAIDGLHRITLEIYAPLGDCASRQPYQPSGHLPGLPPSGQFAADQGPIGRAHV